MGYKTGGRRPGSVNRATREIRELAQQYAPEALNELVRLAFKAKSEGTRVSAIKEIFDRAYGKATQPMEHSSGMRFTHEQALAEIERRANLELGLNEEPKFKLDS